ncbi:MAG: hypothetical protein OEM15_16140 [Myxococcales bacterium]|nr:hypothetical protein [Myxococcales bacterium]MDH3483644.1 hypothetical protein [Myxococcales bacterium]
MAEDEHDVPTGERDSVAASFDFDEESIATLLDTFVATRTGRQGKRISHPPDPSDAGAQAAQRTVFQHGSRKEALPLVGEDQRAKKRRIALLNALAERAAASARARLLTTAAELHEQLGDEESAIAAYRQALDSDARDVVALRALRHHAMRRGDWNAAARALGKEAALDLSPAERASALKLLAHVHLHGTGDSAAAERAAEQAATMVDDDFGALMSLASARIARGDFARAGEAIVRAASVWPDPEAQSVLTRHAGALMEQGGKLESASALYERATDLDPASLPARLGLVRTARELGDSETCVTALLNAAAQTEPPALSRALRRAAATILDQVLGKHEDAMAQLDGLDDVVSLWTLGDIASRADHTLAASKAFDTEAADQSPEAHVMGRARAARLRAELGGELELGANDITESVEHGLGHYVRAWERSTGANRDETELKLVLDAMTAPPQSVAADMMHADKAAIIGDGAAFFASLERELDRASDRLGAALALAEVANEIGVKSRRESLARAKERGGREPIICRALALLDHEDPQAAAEQWLEEGALATGVQGAFALTTAARLLHRAGTDATHVLEAALDEQPDYWPALWELEDRPRESAQRARAAAAQASRAGVSAAAAALRASIWVSSDSDRLAHAETALDKGAPDPLLLEHLIELKGGRSESAGELLALGAQHFEPIPYLERAAVAFQRAGFPARAAKALREALSQAPDDETLSVSCEEAELRAGEFARVADSAMRRAREAQDENEKLGALWAMAAVDRLLRGDMQGARLSLQSIAESRPNHLPTARILEWDSLREQDGERILSSARRVLSCLPEEAPERAARHRLMVEVLRSDPDILPSEVDRLLRGIDDYIDPDPGLARQVLGTAYARKDSESALRALAAIQAHLACDLQRGALALERAHILEEQDEPERAVAVLDEAAAHPLALELEAWLLHAAGRWEAAASLYQEAAARAKDGRRAASLWRAAAGIFEEKLDDPERAVDAYVAATEADITYLDVYRRLLSLYRSEGRLADAEALTESRIEAGADTPTLVAFLLDQAGQRREKGDSAGVIESLRECLELDPSHFVALAELTEALRGQRDWQGAAEALIRIARLKRSIDEQVWAFSQLAEIYDDQLRDLPRAEAALRQVLKLAPAHLETLDRLASVLSSQGKAPEAARVLEEMVRRASNEAQDRDYRIRLAAAIESAGQPREAELFLEQLRSEQPTEVDVILALADQFDRQGASAAAAMHLNRAVADLREAIDEHPEDEALWTTLVRVLNRRHGSGPASCAASAAIALGYPASLFVGTVTENYEALGEAQLPLSTAVDRIVVPKALPPTALRLFSLCEPAFDKVLPFDAAAWRLRRVPGKQRALVEEAGLVAEGLGMSEPKIRLTDASPKACMPISGDPPTLVLGATLAEHTTRRERVFLFARALKVASSHLAPALRLSPEELDAVLLTLLDTHEASRVAPPDAQELRRKLMRAVPRRSRDEVESLVLEIRGDPDFSAQSVPIAIAELGSRVALTLTGDVPSAVNALIKVAGREMPSAQTPRLAVVRATPEAWRLIRFASSDAHFEARTQAGVDR